MGKAIYAGLVVGVCSVLALCFTFMQLIAWSDSGSRQPQPSAVPALCALCIAIAALSFKFPDKWQYTRNVSTGTSIGILLGPVVIYLLLNLLAFRTSLSYSTMAPLSESEIFMAPHRTL